jgi:hypothetical protein
MGDFQLEIVPKCQASIEALGSISIAFYAEPAAAGALLWYFYWADQWFLEDSHENYHSASMYLYDQDRSIKWNSGASDDIGDWDNPGAIMRLSREGSTLKLYLDRFSDPIATFSDEPITEVRSVVIQFCQWWYRPICDELRLDEMKIVYDAFNPPVITSTEETTSTSIQSTDLISDSNLPPLITPLPLFTILGTLVLLYCNKKRVK